MDEYVQYIACIGGEKGTFASLGWQGYNVVLKDVITTIVVGATEWENKGEDCSMWDTLLCRGNSSSSGGE